MDRLIERVPLVLFCAFFIKAGFTGANSTDAIILAISAFMVLGLEWKGTSKQISSLKTEISVLREELINARKDIDKIGSFVNGQKLGQIRVTK